MRALARHYLPEVWTSIEAAEPQVDAMLWTLQRWHSGASPSHPNVLQPAAQNRSALLAALWGSGLIEIAARRAPFEPLAPLDAGLSLCHSVEFTRESLMTVEDDPSLPAAWPRFVADVHHPHGSRLTSYCIAVCDVHLRVRERRPASATEPSAVRQPARPPSEVVAPERSARRGARGHAANAWLRAELRRRRNTGQAISATMPDARTLIGAWAAAHPELPAPTPEAVIELIRRDLQRETNATNSPHTI